jgi:beta-N-acetylhexosaminidase
VLEAKARLGLHRRSAVALDSVTQAVGGRQHRSVARTIAERAVTLIRDEGDRVPWRLPPSASVLYLSVLDYPSGWRIAAPSRTIIPELKRRWAATDAVEVSDRSTASELDLVRTMAGRYDAVVVGVFVRASSGSGRLDLGPGVVRLLQDLSRGASRRSQHLAAVFFGNPYVAANLPELPSALLTYDFSDLAEESAVRALAGEAPIGGTLPISLPGYPAGHGLPRPPR